MPFDTGGGGGGAPTDAQYLTGSADPDLTNETVVQNPENVPNWTEDGNSPQTATGVASNTFTLNGTFDIVQCWVQVEDQSGSTNVLDLRANGDANANYAFISNGDGSTSGATEVQTIGAIAGNDTDFERFTVSGRWANDWQGGKPLSRPSGSQAVGWNNGSLTSPLDSLTIVGDGAFDIAWVVYGLDIGAGGLP